MAKYSNSFGQVTMAVTALGTAPATAGLYYLVGGASAFQTKVSEVYLGGEAASASTVAAMAFGRVSTAANTVTGPIASVLTDIMSSGSLATTFPIGYTTWTTTGPSMAVTGVLLRLSYNAYGGIVRWVSSPDQQITMTGTAAFTSPTQGVGGQLMLQQTAGTAALMSGHVLFEVM